MKLSEALQMSKEGAKAMTRAALTSLLFLTVPAWLGAQTPVDERRPATAAGIVEIQNPAGSVKVIGWDKAEVWVKGTLAGDAGLEFDGSGKRTEIEIEPRSHPHEAMSDLEVHVPAGSHVEIEGFQTEIEVRGVTGSVEAETMSGGISQSGAAKEVSLQSANGSVEVSGARGRIQVEVVNGMVTVEDSSGHLEASTVNGELVVTGGPFESAALESLAGGVRFDADLAAQGRLDIETVSGTTEIFVAPNIKADFTVSTFAGEIASDLGVGTVQKEAFAPAKELSFSTGSGGARIRVETLSGSVHIRKR